MQVCLVFRVYTSGSALSTRLSALRYLASGRGLADLISMNNDVQLTAARRAVRLREQLSAPAVLRFTAPSTPHNGGRLGHLAVCGLPRAPSATVPHVSPYHHTTVESIERPPETYAQRHAQLTRRARERSTSRQRARCSLCGGRSRSRDVVSHARRKRVWEAVSTGHEEWSPP